VKRLLLALLATAAALLVAEGALSLTLNRSLTRMVRDEHAPPRPAPPPARPAAPPQGSPGLYRVHPDPRVGYVLKTNAELKIFDGVIHSDELGLRKRPLPPRGDEALKLVVLGDSVAFGYGLNDDQTLAHQLELLLNTAGETAARAAARSAGTAGASEADGASVAPARPVECRTVAIPGWNHRNAVSCLLDHLDALDPDVVVYLPIPNDLLDSDGVNEDGNRRQTIDAASHDPWLSVNQLASILFARHAATTLEERGAVPWIWLGPDGIMSDLSAESHRRYDENVDSIALLAATIARRGGKLLLLQWLDDQYGWTVRLRLAERGLQVPVLPLFSAIPAALTLGFDPHPNAETVQGMASWVAADLIRRGWVPGELATIPPASEAVRAARGPDRPLAQAAVKATSAQWNAWARLQPAIDLQALLGVGQILGGVNIDGTAGPRALFLLPRGAPTLSVRLAGVAGRPDLYPLEVGVQIDDQLAGTVRIEGEAEVEASFDVPQRPVPAPPIEVRLIPERFAAVRNSDVGWQLVSCRPVRLQCGMPAPEGELPDAQRPPDGTPYPRR